MSRILTLLWVVGCILIGGRSTAQSGESPYHLVPKIDIPLATVGLGGAVLLQLDGVWDTPAPTQQIIAELAGHHELIPSFDRKATYFWSPKAAKASDMGMLLGMASPLLLLADKNIRSDWKTTSVLFVETMSWNSLLTNLTKKSALRYRPYMYNDDASIELAQKLEHDSRYSFYSGHTSYASAACFFAAKVYADHHPDSKLKPYIWAGAALVPATVGVLRVRAGKHFPTDVITGYVSGALIGFLVPHLHKIKN